MSHSIDHATPTPRPQPRRRLLAAMAAALPAKIAAWHRRRRDQRALLRLSVETLKDIGAPDWLVARAMWCDGELEKRLRQDLRRTPHGW
ncbi:DUF1127 domain-containing protein [Aquabacterium sp. A7-Y]|uniref:DUF1127 domain-containing protein n=1 Tax=Aquabacterium sp. A7-Y TaxID=1349605 RepID=UPI00223D6331|nr:DUF1127 domain-containing protein [Aquabacterium sp. A7-Y]MCW7537939.1 DUF1127 domain-containing protein [Aquabacterium sp. A7-Y]